MVKIIKFLIMNKYFLDKMVKYSTEDKNQKIKRIIQTAKIKPFFSWALTSFIVLFF